MNSLYSQLKEIEDELTAPPLDVASMTDAELEAIARMEPDLSHLSDAELETLIR